MNKKRLLIINFVVAVAFGAGLISAESGWLDRLLPKKGGVSAPSTPLIEPPANVLALQDAFAKVAETVKPAVVNISAVQIQKIQQDPYQFYYGDPDDLFRQFFGEPAPQRRSVSRELRREGTGSGVIIDPDGYILTNNHVVQDADQLTVTLSNDKTYKGKVIGTDPRSDLAVIKIKGTKPFPFVPLADSAKSRVGDWVLAFGSPFGLQQTVTSGIISAIRQSLNIEGRSFRNLIQTDAAINRGNSGGALVNLRGELVGINTAIYAPTGVFSGIGFAIPSNDAKLILKDLIEKGHVDRSWMGVEIAPIDDVLAEQFGLPSTEAALVNSVVPGSPAEKSGLKRGDVITEFDGKKVTTVQSLQDTVGATPPGRNVTVKIIRDGTPKSLTLKTESVPKEPQEANDDNNESPQVPAVASAKVEWLGASFAMVTPRLRDEYQIDSKVDSGAVVVKLSADAVAADAGLREGDVVRAVNKIQLRTPSDFSRIKKEADPKKGLVLDVVRQGKEFYLSYKALQ